MLIPNYLGLNLALFAKNFNKDINSNDPDIWSILVVRWSILALDRCRSLTGHLATKTCAQMHKLSHDKNETPHTSKFNQKLHENTVGNSFQSFDCFAYCFFGLYTLSTSWYSKHRSMEPALICFSSSRSWPMKLKLGATIVRRDLTYL